MKPSSEFAAALRKHRHDVLNHASMITLGMGALRKHREDNPALDDACRMIEADGVKPLIAELRALFALLDDNLPDE